MSGVPNALVPIPYVTADKCKQGFRPRLDFTQGNGLKGDPEEIFLCQHMNQYYFLCMNQDFYVNRMVGSRCTGIWLGRQRYMALEQILK